MSDRNRWTGNEHAEDPFAPDVVERTIAASLRQDAPSTPTAVLIRTLADTYALPSAAEAILARSRATLARRAEALASGTLEIEGEQEIWPDFGPATPRFGAERPEPPRRPATQVAAAWRALAAVLVVALLSASFYVLLHGIPRAGVHPTATSAPLPTHPLAWQPVTSAPDGNAVFAAAGASAYTCVVGNAAQSTTTLTVWHTSDRGSTWIPARVLPATPNINRCELVADVSDPYVAALAWQPRGVTWQATPGVPAVPIDQLDSRGGVIYALRETGDGSHLWASTNRMRSWHQVDHGLPPYLTGFWLQPDGAGILVVASNTTSNVPDVPPSLWASPNDGAAWQQVEVPGALSLYWTARDAPLGIPPSGLVARSLQGRFHICALNGAILVSSQLVESTGVACSSDGGATWHIYAMPRLTPTQEEFAANGLLAFANDGSLLTTVGGALFRLDFTDGRWQSLGPLPESGVVFCPAPGDGILWAAPVTVPGYPGDSQHRIFTASYTP